MNDTWEAGIPSAGLPGSIREHVAAQVAMADFLQAQSVVAPRSIIARAFGRTLLTHESRPRYDAALDELAIGDALMALGVDWVVLHAVPVGSLESESESRGTADSATINHIVIGPGGVFALSARIRPEVGAWLSGGAFDPAGVQRNHIRRSELEVGRVERLLGTALESPVRATGVVVVDSGSGSVRELTRDVAVVPAGRIVHWLRSRPESLCADDVDRIAAVAENPATWASSAPVTRDGADLRSDFDRSHREIQGASVIRRLWLIATASALLAGVGLTAWGVWVASTVGITGGS